MSSTPSWSKPKACRTLDPLHTLLTYQTMTNQSPQPFPGAETLPFTAIRRVIIHQASILQVVEKKRQLMNHVWRPLVK